MLYPPQTGLIPQTDHPKESRPLMRGPSRWHRGLAFSSTLALMTGLMVGALPGAPAQAAPGDPTVISLTFDDTNLDQLAAANTMTSLGLYGTFYTNSGWIGLPNYMNAADLLQLQVAGHEIGGHTVNHVDLPTVPAAEAQREVCNDRVALTNLGYRVTSFAYPFASTNAATEAIVQGCGYNSARGLGDLASTPDPESGPLGLPAAETIPPADPYVLAAPVQVSAAWGLSDLQASVTNAEGTGGWVPLTFHHIVDSADPTYDSTLSITPALFTEFVTWLKAQQDAGKVFVKTVDQVVGGAVQPATPGPGLPPPPPEGTNMIQNAGMENLTNNLPACWSGTGFGTNTVNYSVVSPGRSGNNAGHAVMVQYTDGDGKFLQTLDSGTCSPAGTPGHVYTLSAWYTSTAITQFEAYYRSAAGAWVYWIASPTFLASSDWTQVTWTTPALPAGATGISWGLNIFAQGTITTDDYSMIDVTSLTPFTTAPVPTITGSAVSGQQLTAVAGAWNPATDALAYRWNANGVVIPGATASTYTLTNTEIGKTITVSVTGTKAGYVTTDRNSLATAAVTAAAALPFTTAPVPTITGQLGSGQQLTAVAGTWVPAPDALAYQWKANGVAIGGATATTYTLTNTEVGKTITVAVTGAKAGYATTERTSAAVAPNARVTRIGGADRYAVSAAVSKATFSPGVSVAYVASGAVFPDALSGSAAAGKTGSPVLLSATNVLPDTVKAELARLKPLKIVVLGGTGTLTNNVLNALKTYSPTVTRIGGADRYAVSAAVSKATFSPGVSVAYVASGAVFPDALSGSAAAGKTGSPVLLSATNVLPDTVKAELARLKPQKIVVLGGTGTLTNNVLNALKTYSPTVTRIGGADRYAVSAAVSKATFSPGVDIVYVASGAVFPDALSGSAAAGKTGSPVLLSATNVLPETVKAELNRLNPKRIIILGGTGTLSNSIQTQLDAYIG